MTWRRVLAIVWILNNLCHTIDSFTSNCVSEHDFRSSIYVDMVINHMTGGGSGIGSDGSEWNADTLNYPGVPYSELDFH